MPDLILISLSLPDDGAFKLFRLLRANLKTKYTPIFALVVKTDSVAQQQAQQIGFSAIITKPIEIGDLEAKMAKAMNLDTSPRYFSIDKEFFTMRLPENCSPIVINEVNNHLKTKLAEAVNAGLSRAIIDVQEVKSLNMTIIKLLFQTMQTCRELAMQFSLVGNAQIIAECRGLRTRAIGRSSSPWPRPAPIFRPRTRRLRRRPMAGRCRSRPQVLLLSRIHANCRKRACPSTASGPACRNGSRFR